MRIPVAKDGLPIILPSFIIGGFLNYLMGWNAGMPFFIFGLFSVWFFRDPERGIPFDPNTIIAPADGKIIKVEQVSEDPYFRREMKKVSIFMSVFNVHVNRIPCDGVVDEVRYRPGKFVVASLDKASDDNEQNAVIIKRQNGEKVAFVQIAGLIARRIVCRLKKGDNVKRGQRFGMIRFGSRVDLFLPPYAQLTVTVGDKVNAGSSILGYIK
ncbi:MAG TPA: phosphatidylserine decarboxylase family protein [bacterium]